MLDSHTYFVLIRANYFEYNFSFLDYKSMLKEITKIFLFSRSMLCPPLLPCLGSSRQGEEDDDNDDGGNDGYEESDKNGV